MTTNEERHAFCAENPENFLCGCRMQNEDYNDRYNEYERWASLIHDWWAPEFAKYVKARKNIKNYVPINTSVQNLGGAGRLGTSIFQNERQNSETCRAGNRLLVCHQAKSSNGCDHWFPHICKNGGCSYKYVGEDTSNGCTDYTGCNGSGSTNSRVYECVLNQIGQRNILRDWENTVGKLYYPGYCESENLTSNDPHYKGERCSTYINVFGGLEESRPEQPRSQCCENTMNISDATVDFKDVSQTCQNEINENIDAQMNDPELAQEVQNTRSNSQVTNISTDDEGGGRRRRKSGASLLIKIILFLLLIVGIYFLIKRLRSK